jgi:ribulose-5-phosphate 4-epimerase/fuculose-1-phosphate aldolase
MNGKIPPPNIAFQTFFASKEQSNCPLISHIVRISKKLKEMDLLKDGSGIVSLGYGKRVLINGNDVSLGDVGKEDIIEIVDYDPVKRIVLTIGNMEPNIETPVHWLIHHAREDVNMVVQINSKKLVEKFAKKLPSTEKEWPSGSLELAKEVLKTLRTGKIILIKNKGILFVGRNLKEVEDLIAKTFEAG